MIAGEGITFQMSCGLRSQVYKVGENLHTPTHPNEVLIRATNLVSDGIRAKITRQNYETKD